MTVYYWELTADQFANILLIGSAVGYVSGFLLSARIHSRFDKRATIVTTALALSVLPGHAGDPAPVRLLPDNGTTALMWAIAGFGALGAVSGSVLNISVMSALADIADENAVRYGRAPGGILYSARTFFAKLDASLGHGVAAVALAVDRVSRESRARRSARRHDLVAGHDRLAASHHSGGDSRPCSTRSTGSTRPTTSQPAASWRSSRADSGWR